MPRRDTNELQGSSVRSPELDSRQTPAESARDGWAARSARFVTACLLIQCVTGLWVYLAPFSIASQIQILLHVVVGVLLIVPYVFFQVRHLFRWWRQKATATMVLGYLLMAAVVVCIVSGCVLTWESAFGPRLSPVWDLTHLISSFAVCALTPVHLVLAWLRRRSSAAGAPGLARAARGFAISLAGGLAAAVAVVGILSLSWPVTPTERPIPDDYALSERFEQYDEYQGNPFAPTFARTESGRFVDPAVLSGSKSCGTPGCHEQVYEEWAPSAHRFSAMNPPFQAVQRNFAEDRDPVETRYCAGCHDPISLFAGAKDIHQLDLSAPGMQEGCSCVVCHSISKVDQRGNADYVLTPPTKYIWEAKTGWRKFVSDFLIRAYPRQHLADYDRNILRTPEFCGACHKQFIPEALNRFGLSPGQNQYDEWRKSHWHSDDPERDLSCRDCHMRLVRNSTDPGHGEDGDVSRSPGDGAHRHHGTIGTNVLMPAVLKLHGWEKHVRLTEEWMRGETVVDEIADRWPSGPIASVEISAPKQTHAGEEVRLRVLTTNRKAGHNFTTGPLDFVRVWVHLRVEDQQGRAIAEWGAIDEKTRRITDSPGREHRIGNSRKEGTLVLEGQPVDEHGEPLVRHELWKKAGGEGQRVIFPGYSDNQSFAFSVPEDFEGTLRVRADLNFRRYRQEFLDLVVPDMEKESGVLQPTVTQSSDEVTITVSSRTRPGSGSPRGEGSER